MKELYACWRKSCGQSYVSGTDPFIFTLNFFVLSRLQESPLSILIQFGILVPGPTAITSTALAIELLLTDSKLLISRNDSQAIFHKVISQSMKPNHSSSLMEATISKKRLISGIDVSSLHSRVDCNVPSDHGIAKRHKVSSNLIN